MFGRSGEGYGYCLLRKVILVSARRRNRDSTHSSTSGGRGAGRAAEKLCAGSSAVRQWARERKEHAKETISKNGLVFGNQWNVARGEQRRERGEC